MHRARTTDDYYADAQPGKTKDLRQWRMTSAAEIKPAVVKRYLKEAKANAGRA